jgi:hypothetical protein
MKKGIPSGSLYRLIYCSRSRIAAGASPADGPAAIEAELRSILTTCRRRNQADEITGALMFTASGFAQVLEGYREVVERTFERIGADPRHSDVTVLSFTPTEKRCFPDRAMGFCGQDATATPDPLAGLWPEEGASGPRVTTGGDVLRLLEKSAQHEEQWMTA